MTVQGWKWTLSWKLAGWVEEELAGYPKTFPIAQLLRSARATVVANSYAGDDMRHHKVCVYIHDSSIKEFYDEIGKWEER